MVMEAVLTLTQKGFISSALSREKLHIGLIDEAILIYTRICIASCIKRSTNVLELNQHLAPSNPQLSLLQPKSAAGYNNTQRNDDINLYLSAYQTISAFISAYSHCFIPLLISFSSTYLTILPQLPCLPRSSLPDSKSPSRPRNASIAIWVNLVYASQCLCLDV